MRQNGPYSMSMLCIDLLFILLSDVISPLLWSSRMLPVTQYEKSLLRFESVCSGKQQESRALIG